MDAKELRKDARQRMDKALEALSSELARIRTGRATTGLLDSIRVEYYGQKVQLNQVATVNVPEPRLIVIQPWEKKMLPEIEREILKSDLGLNPSNDGTMIRLSIPQLSEERRKELVKLVHKYAEDSRVAIRNIRRDVNDSLKKMEKNHELSEDELSVELEEIQKLTDEHIEKVEVIKEHKEKEVLEI